MFGACYSEPGGTPANVQQLQMIGLLKRPSPKLWLLSRSPTWFLGSCWHRVQSSRKWQQREKKQPWIYMYQQCLQDHFVGQDNVMHQWLAFSNCTQKPDESITDFKTVHQKHCPNVQIFWDDGPTSGAHARPFVPGCPKQRPQGTASLPYIFGEQLACAKSWEEAHNTNIAIMHSANPNLEEQVNQLTNKPIQPPCGKCGWCGGPMH